MPENCEPPPGRAYRYSDVEGIFQAHCHRCHTVAHGTNEAAQQAFESTGYPFTTAVPGTLLKGLAEQFKNRRGLDDAERCLALAWLAGGALDDNGSAPPWPAP
jgi:hypothetical protein